MQKLQQLSQWLQLTFLDQIAQLKPLKEKTTLKPSILSIILTVVLILLLLILNISSFLIAISCTLIPVFLAYKVIQTKDQKQFIKFLVYWMTFGVIEVLFKPILGLLFGDFFLMIFQITLTIALLHPKFNLSLILYDSIIRVYVLKEEEKKYPLFEIPFQSKLQQQVNLKSKPLQSQTELKSNFVQQQSQPQQKLKSLQSRSQLNSESYLQPKPQEKFKDKNLQDQIKKISVQQQFRQEEHQEHQKQGKGQIQPITDELEYPKLSQAEEHSQESPELYAETK